MLWKGFAVLACLVTTASFIWVASIISGHAEGEPTPMDFIGLVISLPTAIGVVCYAFDITLLPSGFWPPFARLLTFFTALSLVGLTLLTAFSLDFANSGWSAVAVMAALYAVAVAFVYFSWLGVRRYALRVRKSAAGNEPRHRGNPRRWP